MNRIHHVQTFIDWDTARRIVSSDVRQGRHSLASRAVEALQDAIASVLMERDARAPFRVKMRIYHGWHRGKTPTEDRREFEKLVLTARCVGNVSFQGDIGYGDRLLCQSRRGCLFDTLRRRQDDGADEQKMVDTALVSDILHHARSKDGDLALVVGDDDDLLPGVFTAESWGADILVARVRRTHDNYHLDTNGLIVRLRQTQT
jgi:hypothetical protein